MNCAEDRYEFLEIVGGEKCDGCRTFLRLPECLGALIDLNGGVTNDDAEELAAIACGDCLDSVLLEPTVNPMEATLTLAPAN